MGLRPGQRSEQPTGRWPANLVLSHAPGCVKVGTKRVKVDTGNTRHKLGADYNGKRGSTPNAPSSSLPTSAYADADGLETVDAWECVEGRSYATYEYAHSSGVLSPLDAPLFLLDRLASLLQAVREYSTNGNSLLRDACEVYRIERTRLAGPRTAWRVKSPMLLSRQNF